MKKIKLFEEFVIESKNILLIERVLDGQYINLENVNEASMSDFKPSIEMVKWAIGDRGKSSANDIIKFATAVAQQWSDLDDDTKEKVADKWYTMKGNFKQETTKIRDAAENGDNMLKAILRDITASSAKAKKMFADRIAPLYANGGEATAKDEEKIKAEIEKTKAELQKAEDAFTAKRKEYDDKKVDFDEVRKLIPAKDALSAKLVNLEGQIDDEAKEDVKELKQLQAEADKAQAYHDKLLQQREDGEDVADELAKVRSQMMDISAEIRGLSED